MRTNFKYLNSSFILNFFSSSNIGEFSKDVKMLAALQEEDNDGDKLLDAARRLAGAFSDLLSAAQPDTQEVSYRPGIALVWGLKTSRSLANEKNTWLRIRYV